MDWGKSFTFVFDDQEWVAKVLIGGILSLIPVVNLVVLGYMLRVIKNVADGAERPLPAWDDLGDYFVKGVMALLGALVWAIPLILLIAVIAVFSVPVSSTVSTYDIQPGRAVPSVFVACVWGMNCLAGLYGLFLGLVLPAAFTRYAVSGEFGAFFRFGDLFKYITANLGNYVIALILAWVAQFVAGFGVVLCFIGVAFTQFWATVVNGHLLGQVSRVAAQAPAAPAPEAAA